MGVMRFATRAIRVGQEPDATFRAVVNPIYQSATFAWEDLDHIPEIDYTRCANPNRSTLEEVIAALEDARHGQCFGSGMAAIASVLSYLKQGESLLMASDIYGGTHRLATTWLPRQGIETLTFDAADPESIRAAVRPSSKMLIFESPTNPNLRVIDIEAVSRIAHEYGLIVVFDNTFASPALQSPLALGIDVVVHSTTKYISGHSDVIGGAVVTNDDTLATHVFDWSKAVGAVPSPFDCWLTLRGVKTLAVRMDRHNQNAQSLAEFLERHPSISKVHYPGLPIHPDHALAKRQMRGFGAMLAIELTGGEAAARRFCEATQVFLLAESLGGVESLVGYPPLMSHGTMTPAERLERGIPPSLVRLSVGIEDIDDLTEDVSQALDHV